MKKFFIIIAMTVLCINCFGQAKAVKKIATKISSKTAKRAALKAAEKRSFEVLVKEGINRTGRKYTGQALGEQVVKRALRERIIKDMEEQGLKSFLEYGKNKALKDVERMGFSSVRKEMITRNGSNAYHSTIKNNTKKLGSYVGRTLTRIAVSSKNQYVSKKQYLKWIARNKEGLEKTGVKDATVLRRNMEKVMGADYEKYAKKTAKNANQAHHIIGNRTPKAAETLKKYGIDINDPMNGIFLPSNTRSGLKGTIHRGGHTQDYYDYVEQMFSTCKSQNDCYEVLDKIKNDLYKGKTKLYSDDVHKVNKIL